MIFTTLNFCAKNNKNLDLSSFLKIFEFSRQKQQKSWFIIILSKNFEFSRQNQIDEKNHFTLLFYDLLNSEWRTKDEIMNSWLRKLAVIKKIWIFTPKYFSLFHKHWENCVILCKKSDFLFCDFQTFLKILIFVKKSNLKNLCIFAPKMQKKFWIFNPK